MDLSIRYKKDIWPYKLLDFSHPGLESGRRWKGGERVLMEEELYTTSIQRKLKEEKRTRRGLRGSGRERVLNQEVSR